MDYFDDIQIEELSGFADFVEEDYEDLFEEDANEDQSFKSFLNSKTDY
jgi:hypothetical protein